MPSDERTPLSGSSRGPRTTDHLTPAQRAVLQIMRDYQFGRLENMRIEAGQPLLGGGTRLVRIARLDGGGHRADVPGEEECELKQEICKLFDELSRLQDCLVVRLEFRHGLPFQLETTPFCSSGGDLQGQLQHGEPHGTRSSRR